MKTTYICVDYKNTCLGNAQEIYKINHSQDKESIDFNEILECNFHISNNCCSQCCPGIYEISEDIAKEKDIDDEITIK